MRSYTSRDLVRILRKAGFVLLRSKGSHEMYVHPDTLARTCVPRHPGDMSRGTARVILKQAGLWEQEQNR